MYMRRGDLLGFQHVSGVRFPQRASLVACMRSVFIRYEENCDDPGLQKSAVLAKGMAHLGIFSRARVEELSS